MNNRIRTIAAALALTVLPTMSAYAAGGNGMTWAKYSHDAAYGIDKVGCAGCNAYTGDTSCAVSLPVLCIRNDGSPRPPYVASPSDFYDGWSQGHITHTLPVLGASLTTATTGDQLCAAYFGTGWRMAQHHDNLSGGWGFRAFGNVRNNTRYWVKISDQPANCWNP